MKRGIRDTDTSVCTGEDSQLLSPHRGAQHSAAPHVTFKTRFPRKLAVALSEGGAFLIKKHTLGVGELGFASPRFWE